MGSAAAGRSARAPQDASDARHGRFGRGGCAISPMARAARVDASAEKSVVRSGGRAHTNQVLRATRRDPKCRWRSGSRLRTDVARLGDRTSAFDGFGELGKVLAVRAYRAAYPRAWLHVPRAAFARFGVLLLRDPRVAISSPRRQGDAPVGHAAWLSAEHPAVGERATLRISISPVDAAPCPVASRAAAAHDNDS